jgi:hypothetical protein
LRVEIRYSKVSSIVDVSKFPNFKIGNVLHLISLYQVKVRRLSDNNDIINSVIRKMTAKIN